MTHAEQMNNILAHLETNHRDTRWQTEQGYNDSLRAIEYAKHLESSYAELLEALEALSNRWTGDVEYYAHGDDLIKARAAIAKAKGEA